MTGLTDGVGVVGVTWVGDVTGSGPSVVGVPGADAAGVPAREGAADDPDAAPPQATRPARGMVARTRRVFMATALFLLILTH
ncbi:hypothetical protein Psi02_36620 [Planotetraspora silvatica]|uniref:Uncharacterized protein n=1 Tax=Planotetraspora silvatica TaxID=234614 RepID=A0A8J3XSF0_9ACTN|nr:hypothetical protein Psi02_36620 [Planotetraspora silvatica]